MNLILTLLAVLLQAPAGAAEVSFKGFDVYRSKTLTAEMIEEEVLPLVRSYVSLRGAGSRTSLKRAKRLKGRIEGRVRGLADLAYVNMHYSQYFTSSKRTAYVTFDVVDRADAGTRLPFRPKPTKSLKDPEGLIADWGRYVAFWDAASRTQSTISERYSCPAYYCRWGDPTPEIEKLDRHFKQFAKPNRKALDRILREEADPAKREAAVYLFSYIKDPKKASAVMAYALEDPAERVRTAALEVLSDISIYHSEVPLGIEKLVGVLDYPSTSDRSNAMAVLVGKNEDPDYRPYILKRGAASLVDILKLKQPSNHDLAYTLLGLLSRESYDRRDYDSWERWLSKQKIFRNKR